MIFLSSMFIGVFVGLMGYKYQWSYLRTLLVGACVGAFVGMAVALFHSNAEASEAFSQKLRVATAHLMNGSGFVVKAPKGKTYLVTNYHVCLHGSWQNILTGSLETGEVVRGKVVKKDLKPDLCAAEIKSFKTPLSIAPQLTPLDPIYTRGYPYGVLSESRGKYVGVMGWTYDFPIEEIGECPKTTMKLQGGDGVLWGCRANFIDNLTDLYSRPGSSGSPVVNSKGELVGVMSSWMSASDAGGMVRLEDIKEFFRGL